MGVIYVARQDALDREVILKVVRSDGASGEVGIAVEGLPAADWVLVDSGDIVIHLFRPEVRAFYNIEKIWAVGTGPAPLVS